VSPRKPPRGPLRRLRDRLRGDRRDPGAYRPDLHKELEDWTEVAEQGLKLVGAGMVQAWEVNLAEVRPILVAHNGEAVATEQTNRWSDALVPLETPFQHIIRGCPAVLGKGLDQARSTGQLAPLTDELLHRIDGLGPLTADGWGRALNHIGPILDTLPNPDAIKERIADEGPKLGRELAAASLQLRESVDRAGATDRVGHALFEAIDTWKDAVIRSMEFAVAAQLEAVEAAQKRT